MFSTSDTIVAIATPPGRGGIGVVRLSGPDAHAVACAIISRTRPLEPRLATLTTVRLPPPRPALRRAAPKQREGGKPDTTYNGGRHEGAPREDVGSDAASAFRTGALSTQTAAPAQSPIVSDDIAKLEIPAREEAVGADDRQAYVVSAARRTLPPGAIDQVVVTSFPAPGSYTGDDVVEIAAHGSPVVLRAIVAAAIARGARLAEPGEFTLRAFLNGRIDLPQAEAIGDLIDAATPLQARAAFDQLQGTLTGIIAEIDAALFDLVARLEASIDFPEEGYHFLETGSLASALDVLIERTGRLLADGARGRLVREGLQVAIVGKPNVGKSSVFNALVGASRAIVTDVPGTTRDLVTEVVDLDGLRVTLVDTAGVRATDDAIEGEGVRRALQARAVADLLLVVLDGSSPLDDEDREILSQTADRQRLAVHNKSDLAAAWQRPDALRISATTGDGIVRLRDAMCAALDVEPLSDPPDITNVRHIALVRTARTALLRAREAAGGASLSEEFVLADLQEARTALEEISGRRVSDDLLAHIFSKFCIGK